MITEKQLETHKTLLGSSEIAAVMGLNPYQTAYDVWAVKTDKVLPVADRDEMTIGRVFEAGILDLFSREKDVIITTEAKKLEFIDNDFKLVSHPDALVIKELNALLTPAQQIFVSYLPVEAKAVGFKNLRMLDGWGETEDEIPPMYQMQCQVHLICTGKDLCYLAAMLAGRGLVIYEIHPHPVFQDLIKEAAVNFFERYVIPDIPPPDSVPTEDTIKRLRRVPNKTVSVPADIFRDYRDQNEQLKVLEKYVEEAKRKLLALLGDAEGAVCDDPTLGGFTYFQYDRTSLDTHALKNEQPEIWQKYQRTGSFRRLNLKKKMER